jgi:hypothetical protein
MEYPLTAIIQDVEKKLTVDFLMFAAANHTAVIAGAVCIFVQNTY